MSLTINHDVRRLMSLRAEEVGRYIDQCMTRAYAEARNSYREELSRGLEMQAERTSQMGGILRIPLPVPAPVCIGEATTPVVAERMTWVEFTPDQIRAFAHFMTGVRP